MAYSYGYTGGRYGGGMGGGYGGGGYGGGYGGDSSRHAPYGGDGAYGVYSGDRDYDRGYGGSYGGGMSGGHGGGGRTDYRTDTYYTSGNRGGGGYGGDRSYGGVGTYGGGYGSGVRDVDYEREQRITRKTRMGGASYGNSRSNRDTGNFSKYRNNRDNDTDTSTDDDDNHEGFMQRAADKIKGVFGMGQNGNNNDNDTDYRYGGYSGGVGGYSSSRKNKSYNDTSNRYTSSYGNNTGSYGGGYGSYRGGNDIVSLRSRREVAPSMNEESGNKSLLWQIDVRGFDLDNIRVSDAGNNKIEISGHAEDVGPHYRRTKQFTRVVTLPEGSNAKEVKSRISGNGLLTITVPYTGKGLQDYGTRELQVGQGSTQSALTGRSTGSYGTSGGSSSNTSGTTGSYGTSGGNTSGTTGYQSHTTTTATRSSTNNQ